MVLGAAAALLVAALLVRYLTQRSLCRRLGALCARLGDDDVGLDVRKVEIGMSALERLVDAKVASTGESGVVADRFRQALERVGRGVILANEVGAIVFRNAAAADLLGGDEPDPDAEAEVSQMLLEALNGPPQQADVTVSGDQPRQLRVDAQAIEDKWRTVGALAIVEDVSERHHLEAVRRDFVANISHELKTPVGALALLADTLSSEVDPIVAQRLSRRLMVEAQRVGRVVDDLIELTRIQSEEEAQRESVAIHLVVAQAAERVRSLAQEREMTINFGEPPQRLWVLADRRQLVAAVFNLLENAVKYSPPGSTVEVRARPEGNVVELSVSDEGVGIPERDHERIFERFYRVGNVRAGDGGGTGLGLALVRNVIDNHRGEVIVESGEGQGSTFTLRLPAADPAVVSPARAG